MPRHEVIFLKIGDQKSGDAIILIFDDIYGQRRTAVIDSGYQEDGARILEKLRAHNGHTKIDYLILTHPDDDHMGGMKTVIEQAESIGTLLIHRPSLHGFAEEDDVKVAETEELVSMAQNRGATVVEPFVGEVQPLGGLVHIAGPTRDLYDAYLAEEGNLELINAIETDRRRLSERLRAGYIRASSVLSGDPGETLTTDHGGTTPRNNHSVILYLYDADEDVLLTGDAGVQPMHAALDYVDGIRSVPSHTIHPTVVKHPHHGSRHNMDLALANRLYGPKHGKHPRMKGAFFSAALNDDDHPKGSVVNAAKRRGYGVHTTQKRTWLYLAAGAPERPEYPAGQSEDWYPEGGNE